MFFIGIFGVEEKEKQYRIPRELPCKNCSGKQGFNLIKRYRFFHVFFIPIVKWQEEYFIICKECEAVYQISKEKGKKIENGQQWDISYWDLQVISFSSNLLRKNCRNCGKEISEDYEYCPYCGEYLRRCTP